MAFIKRDQFIDCHLLWCFVMSCFILAINCNFTKCGLLLFSFKFFICIQLFLTIDGCTSELSLVCPTGNVEEFMILIKSTFCKRRQKNSEWFHFDQWFVVQNWFNQLFSLTNVEFHFYPFKFTLSHSFLFSLLTISSFRSS